MKTNQSVNFDKDYFIRTYNRWTFKEQLIFLKYWYDSGELDDTSYYQLIEEIFHNVRTAYCPAKDHCFECRSCPVTDENRPRPLEERLQAISNLRDKGVITSKEMDEYSRYEYDVERERHCNNSTC